MPSLTFASSRWLTCFRNSQEVRMRLFCAPYAGGGAQVFQRWPERLPAGIEVCCLNLPGRGKRFVDPPFSELMPLVGEATDAVLPLLDRPFALFGHSMGALISFEITRSIRKLRQVSPVHLFVSGCFAPHLPDPHPMHSLAHQEFVDDLLVLNGVPREALEDQELMELVLPALRADFTAAETYVHAHEPALSCPITAFAGSRDPLTTLDSVEAWRVHTTGAFSFRILPGDHFFLVSQQSLLLSMLAAELNNA